MDESTLRMCIVAVAARHFANTNRSFDHIEDVSCQFVNANLDALHFKRKAIKALSSSLNCLEPSQQDVVEAGFGEVENVVGVVEGEFQRSVEEVAVSV